MKYKVPLLGLALFLWITLHLSAVAHGDSHEMVKAMSDELKSKPRDADLYFRRGELHRRHSDWDLALADFEMAGRFSTNAPMLDLARGLLFVEAQWPQSAKIYLDRFLTKEPKHVVALTARAKTLLRLEDRDGSVRDYTAALQFSNDPRPDLYIERAQALVTDDKKRLKEAIEGLEEGIRKLGSLVNLQLNALDLELRNQQTNAALKRLDQVIHQSPRKEMWYARKGEILQSAHRWAEAKEAYGIALEQLRTLPDVRRNVPAMQELGKRIQSALAEVTSKP